MWYILSLLLIIAGLALVYFLVKCLQNSTTKGRAREIAKTCSISLFACKEAHPEWDKQQQYGAAIATRPGWDIARIESLFLVTKAAAESMGEDINWQILIMGLVAMEHAKMFGCDFRKLPDDVRKDIAKGVSSMVSPDW